MDSHRGEPHFSISAEFVFTNSSESDSNESYRQSEGRRRRFFCHHCNDYFHSRRDSSDTDEEECPRCHDTFVERSSDSPINQPPTPSRSTNPPPPHHREGYHSSDSDVDVEGVEEASPRRQREHLFEREMDRDRSRSQERRQAFMESHRRRRDQPFSRFHDHHMRRMRSERESEGPQMIIRMTRDNGSTIQIISHGRGREGGPSGRDQPGGGEEGRDGDRRAPEGPPHGGGLMDMILRTILGGNSAIPLGIGIGGAGLASNPRDYAWGPNGMDNIISFMLGQLGDEGPPPADKDKVQLLKRRIAEGSEIGTDCSICQETYSSATEVVFLPCGHYFHPDCILPWFNLHDTCPTCRFSINNGKKPYQTGPGPSDPDSGQTEVH